MPDPRPRRILFVCTGNSARSQMAEGFARAYAGGQIEAFSAGMDPRRLNQRAVDVMREVGIDISQQQSKAFSEDLARTMDDVITVCGHAEEQCPILPPEVRRVHWPLDDPTLAEGSPEQVRQVFRQSREDIDRLIRQFLAHIERPHNMTQDPA